MASGQGQNNPLAAMMQQQQRPQGPQPMPPQMMSPQGMNQGGPMQRPGGPNTMFRPQGFGQGSNPMTPPGMGQPAPQTGWNGHPLNMPDLGTFGTGPQQMGPKPGMNMGDARMDAMPGANMQGSFGGQALNAGQPQGPGNFGMSANPQAAARRQLQNLLGGGSKGMPSISPSL